MANDRSLEGQRLGPYRLERFLARGGMGEVYEALDQRLGRRVALKCMHPGLAQDKNAKRLFLREAQLAATVEHPNIVRLYELGEAEGRLFLVMELVRGRDLTKLRAPDVPFSARVAARIGIDGANALHQLWHHRRDDGQPRRLVHRDVSASNIMVSERGEVKLLDFGVARAADVVSLTLPGQLRGKIRYMAPEMQSEGIVDHRTDLFALGVVVTEALTTRFAPDEVGPGRRANVPAVDALLAATDAVLALNPSERSAAGADFAQALRDAAERHDGVATDAELRALLGAPDVPIASSALDAPTNSAAPDLLDDGTTASVQSHPEVARTRTIPPARRRTPWLMLVPVALAAIGAAAFLVRDDWKPPPSVAAPTLAETAPIEAPIEAAVEAPIEAAIVEPGSPKASVEGSSPRPTKRRRARRRRAPPPPIEAAAVAPGAVWVISEPWAYLYIDGVSHKATPRKVSLPPGVHLVELRDMDQRVRFRRRVTVISGETATLKFGLE